MGINSPTDEYDNAGFAPIPRLLCTHLQYRNEDIIGEWIRSFLDSGWNDENLLKIAMSNKVSAEICEKHMITDPKYNWGTVESLLMLALVTRKPIINSEVVHQKELTQQGFGDPNAIFADHLGANHIKFYIPNFHRTNPEYLYLYHSPEHFNALIQSMKVYQLNVPVIEELEEVSLEKLDD